MKIIHTVHSSHVEAVCSMIKKQHKYKLNKVSDVILI